MPKAPTSADLHGVPRSPDAAIGSSPRDLRGAHDAQSVGTSPVDCVLSTAEQLTGIGTWRSDLRSGETVWSPGMFRLLGLEPEDRAFTDDEILEYVHPADRDRIAAALAELHIAGEEAAEAGNAVEFRVVRADGAVREVRARGHLEADQDGKPIRWVGSLQDVTEHRLMERSLLAHHAVSRALGEWRVFEEGVLDLLRRTGTALDYDLGSLWVWDAETERLTCRAFWADAGVDAGEFENATRTITFLPGEGVPGEVWVSGEPLVMEDVTREPSFVRARSAARLGLRSGIAFPVIAPSGPLAVMSFYSRDFRPANAWLKRTLSEIGRDIGRFLGPRLAELGPRRLTPRELEVLRLAAEGNTGPQIAEQLIVSPGTVKTHFEHIYEKLGVGDRAAAVAFGLRSGLIQ
jgi:PAS domain S-box-containing protein